MDDADAAIAAEQQEVKNPFPTPPAYWMRYTPENLRLLGVLKEKLGHGEEWIRTRDQKDDEENVDQEALLSEETLLPSFPLLELEPPRLDWVLEQEEYSSFGELYPTNEITQVFPPGLDKLHNLEPGTDRRPQLRQLLVSLLNAYHKLLSDVLEPVPSGYHRPPSPSRLDAGGDPSGMNGNVEWPPPLNWEATILWIRTLVLNLGWMVNEFRPIQARMTLESMMQRQIETRREETRMIHGKCDELEKTLADLRAKASTLLPSVSDSTPQDLMIEGDSADLKTDMASSGPTTSIPSLTIEDVIAWSQEATI